MYKEETIKDLTKICSKWNNHKKNVRHICIRGSITSIPKGVTINTDNLRSVELIHMEFFFLNEISIREFTCVLLAVCVKIRQLWTFSTQRKRPPLYVVRLFLTQLEMQDILVSSITTYQGE